MKMMEVLIGNLCILQKRYFLPEFSIRFSRSSSVARKEPFFAKYTDSLILKLPSFSLYIFANFLDVEINDLMS